MTLRTPKYADPFALRLTANTVGLCVLYRGRMTLDADTHRNAVIERLFVLETQLFCEFVNPDLLSQLRTTTSDTRPQSTTGDKKHNEGYYSLEPRGRPTLYPTLIEQVTAQELEPFGARRAPKSPLKPSSTDRELDTRKRSLTNPCSSPA